MMLGMAEGPGQRRGGKRGLPQNPPCRAPEEGQSIIFGDRKSPGCCSKWPHATAQATATCFHKIPMIYKPISQLLWAGEG